MGNDRNGKSEGKFKKPFQFVSSHVASQLRIVTIVSRVLDLLTAREAIWQVLNNTQNSFLDFPLFLVVFLR